GALEAAAADDLVVPRPDADRPAFPGGVTTSLPAGGSGGRPHQEGKSAHLAAQLRDAPARGGRGPADDPAAAGAPGFADHGPVHARDGAAPGTAARVARGAAGTARGASARFGTGGGDRAGG